MTEEKQRWEGVIINIQKGDIITSKKGVLNQTALLKRFTTSKRMKYLGGGLWETLDNPIEIKDVAIVKE